MTAVRLEAAAARAGAEFVPVGDAFDGHEPCTPSSWVVPVPLVLLATEPRIAHPKPAGEAAMARRVQGHLKGPPA